MLRLLRTAAWLSACLLLFTACASRQPTGAPELPTELEALAPQMLEWFNRTEARLIARGRPLSEPQRAMARSLGVRRPERVRVVVTETFPMPQSPALREKASELGLEPGREAGRAMGYAILLKPGVAENRYTLAHELVHVAQMERLGREAFLGWYFAELARVGHARSRLEGEAEARARQPGTARDTR